MWLHPSTSRLLIPLPCPASPAPHHILPLPLLSLLTFLLSQVQFEGLEMRHEKLYVCITGNISLLLSAKNHQHQLKLEALG